MKSTNGCPFCKETVINIVNSEKPSISGYQVQCENCGSRGPICDDKDEAIKSWELGISSTTGRVRNC
jgi:hypothetical protein